MEQSILQDVMAELDNKFKPKKLMSSFLAKSYKRIGTGFETKATSVKDCGNFLAFQSGKLQSADFCRDRLCPMCSWRKTLKIAGQVSSIVDEIVSDYDFIFLTLTIPNCSGSDLSKTVVRLYHAWSKLRKRKRFSDSVCGYFKALEITRNTNKRSGSYGTYHPHFHVILAVKKDYFTSDDYIKRSEWLDMWRSCYGDNSITQLDVRKCYSKNKKRGFKSLSSAVVEGAKYAVKPSSYLGNVDKKGNFTPFAESFVDESVETLSDALKYRRIFEMRGIFREIFDKLGFDDAEEGDLVVTDTGEVIDIKTNTDPLYIYRWSFRDKCYTLYKIYHCSYYEQSSEDEFYSRPPVSLLKRK